MSVWLFSGRKNPARRSDLEKNPGSFGLFRKTTLTYARRIDVPFEVETEEGLMQGKAGDWLAIGAYGEAYPIDADVFADTYEEAFDPFEMRGL